MERANGTYNVQVSEIRTPLHSGQLPQTAINFISYVHCTSLSDIILLLEIQMQIQHYNHTIIKK